jgi:hypothetical protein
MMLQRVEYRAFCNPDEKQDYIKAIKAHGYIVCYDEKALMHDFQRPDGKLNGIACEKVTSIVFEEEPCS